LARGRPGGLDRDDALLTHWKDVNDKALREVIDQRESTDGEAETVARVRLQLLTDLFICETAFSSKFDLGVRKLARKDSSVAQSDAHRQGTYWVVSKDLS
jgi:hypothetical protein